MGEELGGLVAVTSEGAGDGPQVVLVPGLAVSRYLRRARDLIASEAGVHLVELPGTGSAADPPRPLDLTQDASAVTGWIRATLAGPVVLVGHSYGSQVVPRVAVALPGQVRALVLASPTIDPAYRSVARVLWRFALASRGESPDLARFQWAEQRRAGGRRILRMWRSMLKDDPEEMLRTLDVPLTVVRGDRDALSTRAWARRLADRPGGDLVEVPDATHAFPYAHPGDLAEAVTITLRKAR